VSFGPDGTAYAIGLGDDPGRNATGVAVATSYNGGRSWRNVTDLIDDPSAEFGDDKTSITADPVRAGTAYAVWDRLDFGPNGDGSKFTGPALLAVTHDSGRTWSKPQVMVGTTLNQQTIGNDIRTLPPNDTTTLPTTTWLATAPRGGEHFTERQIAPPFDLLTAPNAGGFFVGDYEGLAAGPGSFRALFVKTTGNPADPTDVFTGSFPAVPAGIAVTPAPGHAAGTRPAAPHPGLAHGERCFYVCQGFL
jgi:hypothetical protein